MQERERATDGATDRATASNDGGPRSPNYLRSDRASDRAGGASKNRANRGLTIERLADRSLKRRKAMAH